MNQNIDNLCYELRNFAHSLKQEVALKVKDILPQGRDTGSNFNANLSSQSVRYVSNPERPWMIAGGTGLAIGVIGAISTGATWSYLLGAAGVISILWGQSKKKQQQRTSSSKPVNSNSAPNSYEVAEKLIDLSNKIEDKWRSKVEEFKIVVQGIISASSTSADLKDLLLSQTYITERVSIDFDKTLYRLEHEPVSSYTAILSEYERIANNSIDKTTDEQIAIYKNISQNI